MKPANQQLLQAMAPDARSRSNLRLALLLGAIALAFFFGYLLRAWLLRS